VELSGYQAEAGETDGVGDNDGVIEGVDVFEGVRLGVGELDPPTMLVWEGVQDGVGVDEREGGPGRSRGPNRRSLDMGPLSSPLMSMVSQTLCLPSHHVMQLNCNVVEDRIREETPANSGMAPNTGFITWLKP